jgi:hypothetical protein
VWWKVQKAVKSGSTSELKAVPAARDSHVFGFEKAAFQPVLDGRPADAGSFT